MIPADWFQQKWGITKTPVDDVYSRLSVLESKVEELQEKYQGALIDIKKLEEENIENTNLFYELIENIRAVDARIDILKEHEIDV